MIIQLRSLIIALRNRLQDTIEQLERKDMSSEIAIEFKKTAVLKLFELKSRAVKVLNSGILDFDFFLPNCLIIYNSLVDSYNEFERFLILPIVLYNDQAEGYFETVIRTIYSDIGCAQQVPFISTTSNSSTYFWAYEKFHMIALPQGEEKYLLNLSDLYHEIGHLLYRQLSGFLINDFLPAMETYYRAVEKKLKRRDTKGKETIQLARDRWHATWVEELACDLIAAYLVGPAYGWSHMKLCVESSNLNRLYHLGEKLKRHPPDEVRMRAILCMLRHTGHNTDADSIEQSWKRMLTATRNGIPDNYETIFAQELIESITANVLEGCQNSALLSYSEQLERHTQPISKTLNDAWAVIRTEPEKFGTWETSQITNIGSRRSLSFGQ